MTGRKFETEAEDFKQQARRGAREFLGVAQTDVSKRPLVASRGVWGLTVSAQYMLWIWKSRYRTICLLRGDELTILCVDELEFLKT